MSINASRSAVNEETAGGQEIDYAVNRGSRPSDTESKLLELSNFMFQVRRYQGTGDRG